MRLVPVLGLLAVLAFVPGALAHHCTPDDEQNAGSDFSVQSAAPPSFSPVMLAAFLIVPFVIVGAIAAAVRGSAKVVPQTGTWVCTPAAWVWVPDRK